MDAAASAFVMNVDTNAVLDKVVQHEKIKAGRGCEIIRKRIHFDGGRVALHPPPLTNFRNSLLLT